MQREIVYVSDPGPLIGKERENQRASRTTPSTLSVVMEKMRMGDGCKQGNISQ